MRRGLGALLLALAFVSPSAAQLGVPRVAPAPSATFTPVQVLPMGTRPAGPFGFQAVNVPTGVVGLKATMDISEATDPLPSIAVTLEGSLDGGATWMGAGRFDNPAGPKGNNRVGQPKTALGASWGGGPFWEASTNPNRQLRGAGTLGATMRFALTVTPL